MEFISRAVDKFCLTHRRFGIPRLIFYIVAGTIALYALSWLDLSGTVMSLMYFDAGQILRGQVWRLITWVFIPMNSNPFFVALSAYCTYFIGMSLERVWGAGKFTIFYTSGVIISTVYAFITQLAGIAFTSPSIIYVNLSLLLAFALLYPDAVFRIYGIIPISAKILALIDVAVYAFYVLQHLRAGLYFDALFPIIALANYILICGIPPLRRRSPPRRAGTDSNIIDFKKAVRQSKRAKRASGGAYRHKCEICGRTDVSDPELGFRYCSRCEGLHCYCADHIESHRHQ